MLLYKALKLFSTAFILTLSLNTQELMVNSAECAIPRAGMKNVNIA